MTDSSDRLSDRISRWIGGLPVVALLGIGALVVAGVVGGGYYAYETYDYVQHDNDFCLSCHLMVDPYEQFAESAHRGLGCKACHQPTLVARSTMAITQVLENPEELGVHAEVPNRVCADCHIEGDPEKWALVANTAGHRVHLESTDPELDGLQCVECHSTSVHEFAATDRTCAQSGCHTDNKIMLGDMADLTIHCAACHTFTAPVDEEGDQASALAAMAPAQGECLSCHAMRTLVDLPDPDPHEGACAACHNPHTQEVPEDAVESCATAGCHTQADTLTPLHRGMGAGVLEDCAACHQAHDFEVDAANCLSCHQDIYETDAFQVVAGASPGGTDPAALSDDPFAELRGGVLHPAGWGMADAIGSARRPSGARAPEPAPTAQEAVVFRHDQHRDVDCASCHSTEEEHGAVTVTGIADCRGCHHTEPERLPCAQCHAEGAQAAGPYTATRTLALSVGDRPGRALPFDHDDHTERTCDECHTEGLALDAAAVDCTSCHQEHHALENDCASCHVEAPASEHPREEVHRTCSGSGCHTDAPFAEVPRTRTGCLVCHQELVEHRVGQSCAECHALGETPARSGAGADR